MSCWQKWGIAAVLETKGNSAAIITLFESKLSSVSFVCEVFNFTENLELWLPGVTGYKD